MSFPSPCLVTELQQCCVTNFPPYLVDVFVYFVDADDSNDSNDPNDPNYIEKGEKPWDGPKRKVSQHCSCDSHQQWLARASAPRCHETVTSPKNPCRCMAHDPSPESAVARAVAKETLRMHPCMRDSVSKSLMTSLVAAQ